MWKRSRKRDFYSADKGKKAGKTSGPVSGLLFFVCYFCGLWGYLRLCSLIFRLNYSLWPVAFVLAGACAGLWLLQDIVKCKPVCGRCRRRRHVLGKAEYVSYQYENAVCGWNVEYESDFCY